MADERVYSLGATGGTTPAEEVSLSALSFKERKDLQQWILADTTLVEPGLLVLTEESTQPGPRTTAPRSRIAWISSP